MTLNPKLRIRLALTFLAMTVVILFYNLVLVRLPWHRQSLKMLPADGYEVMVTTADQMAQDRERTNKSYAGDSTVWDTHVRPFQKAIGDGKQYVVVSIKGSVPNTLDTVVPLCFGLAALVLLWPMRLQTARTA